MTQSCLAVVLAAGEGKRMLSARPKVLHKIAGLEMVCHVMLALSQAGCDQMALVVGRYAEEITKSTQNFAPTCEIYSESGGKPTRLNVKKTNDNKKSVYCDVSGFEKITVYHQDQPLGTAHAALAARAALEDNQDADVLIVFGDTPLLEPPALARMREELAQGADVVVSGFYPENPTGYGRLIEKAGHVVAIIEEKDATPQQRKLNFCNGGVMALRGRHAVQLLEQVDNNNAAGEYYLPDIVAHAYNQGLKVHAVEVGMDTVMGVNSRADLAMAEDLWQQRKRQDVMAQGVTLIAPQTVYFAYDSDIASDVIIEPHVFFGPGVKVEQAAYIRAFSHIEGTQIGAYAQVGPFARLRPGTFLDERVKVGNFCEIKQAKVAQGAKINHLSYIGDAEVGVGVNIGAGTITCNYDGLNKFSTVIGQGAFVGSNSALIAPVTIGEGAYIASGSVITQDVEPQALAFGRARQINKPERARELRHRQQQVKERH